MATTLTTSGLSYDVKHNPEIFGNLLEGAHTLKNGNISVLPNVKSNQIKLNKFTTTKSGLVQEDDRDCAWEPNGAITLAEKTVSLVNLKVQMEICLDELDKLYSQEQYKAVRRGEMAPDFETFVLKYVQNAIDLDNESFIWTASVSSGAPLDGIITQAVADAATNSGAGTEFTSANTVTGTTLSSANILGEIVKVYNKIPQAVLDAHYQAQKDEDKCKIFVPATAFRYAMQALSSSSAPTDVNVQLPAFTKEGDAKNLRIFYLGVEIVIANVGTNNMFAAQVGNLVVVTDIMSDATIEGERGKEMKTKNIYYMECKYKFAATYVKGDECVLYA